MPFEPDVSILGLQPSNWTTNVYVRDAAAVKGQLLQFYRDPADDTFATTFDPGVVGSVYANVDTPTTEELSSGFFCIALESAAENSLIRVGVRGVFQALVSKASESIAVGDPLVGINAARTLDGVLTGGSKILGKATEALTTPGAGGVLSPVIFDGINGLGTVNTVT